MNNLPFFVCVMMAMMGCAVSTASAQVKPPDAKDTDGNEYRYPVQTITPPMPPAWEKDYVLMKHKLATIIIPRLDFHDTPLTDAIEQIRKESVRLDTDPDPAARGLNIFLKLPAASTMPPTHVTLTLTNIPVSRALRSVARQAGMTVTVVPNAISLVQVPGFAKHFSTVECRMPQMVINILFDWPGTLTSDDLRERLEAKGAVFPLGSTATYVPATQKLVIYNTMINILPIESLVNDTPTVPIFLASHP